MSATFRSLRRSPNSSSPSHPSIPLSLVSSSHPLLSSHWLLSLLLCFISTLLYFDLSILLLSIGLAFPLIFILKKTTPMIHSTRVCISWFYTLDVTNSKVFIDFVDRRIASSVRVVGLIGSAFCCWADFLQNSITLVDVTRNRPGFDTWVIRTFDQSGK